MGHGLREEGDEGHASANGGFGKGDRGGGAAKEVGSRKTQ